VPGGRESAHITDLGDDQHRRIAPDAVDLAQQPNALVAFGLAVDVFGGSVDLPVEVLNERQQAVDSLARRRSQLDRGEELSPGLSEQVGVLVDDAVPGEDRVHAILDRRAHRHERDPVAQQLAHVAQLPRSDVRLGQQAGAQQLRQHGGVDRVGFHPRCGDRAGPERMREVQLKAGVGEQVG
jgi:hypothetical protein